MVIHNHRMIFFIVMFQLILGFTWYSQLLFLDSWLALIGKRLEDVQQSDPLPFIIAINGYFFVCYVLSWLVQRLEIQTLTGGAMFAILLWLAFVFPVIAVHYQFIGHSWALVGIDALRELASLILAGSVLAKWGHMPRAVVA